MSSYRWGLLGKLSVKPVGEALQQRVPTRDDDAAVQALKAGSSESEPSRVCPAPCSLESQTPYRANVNVAHADAGGDYVAHTQHGVARQALWTKGIWALGTSGLCSQTPVVIQTPGMLGDHHPVQCPSPTLTLEGSNRPSGMRSRSAP